MVKLFHIAVLTFFINYSLQAQLGVSIIGTSSPGIDSLSFIAIGKTDTPYCAFPGPAGSPCAIYHFTGAGNWNIEGNWEANLIPPVVLTGCSQILIDPAGNNECLLNIPMQFITAGSSIKIISGKRFRIPGKLVNH